MAFKPNDIKKEHILEAIKKIENENIQLIPPTRWKVVINNENYPPKEVMRYAHEQMNGEKLWNYGGGEGTNKYLKKFDFEMIDMQQDGIQKLIEDYKKHIKETHLKDEVYKWQLVNEYKGRPNLDAEDLHEEIKEIDYNNLIYKLGKGVLLHLASVKPNELRECLKNLFDEKKLLTQRVKTYNEETLILYRSIGQKLQHHQDERTIATYLTFHNPEKYTFYKYSFYKKMCELLNEKEAKKNEKYEHYLGLVNKIIKDYIQDDTELIDLVKSYIPDYYDGSNHLLLTQDILYQMLDKKESVNYWLYAPGENAHKWDEFYEEGIMGLGWDDLGDLDNYANKSEIKKKLQDLENVESTKQNDTAANYEFHKVIKEGDIIIVKKGISELLGYGEVTSDYFYDENRSTYQKCREVDWKLKGNWKVDFKLPVKTLTDVTKYPTEDKNYSKYSERLLAIMEGNMNATLKNDAMNYNVSLNQILYGPPGTGKTYETINKAISIINPSFVFNQERKEIKKEFDLYVENGQVVFTTFHQSMSYEDFIEGIKPKTVDGEVVYEIENGIFKKLCIKAEEKKIKSNNFDEAYQLLLNEIDSSENNSVVLETLIQSKEFTIYKNSKNNIRFHANTEKAYEGVIKKEVLEHYLKTGETLDWPSYVKALGNYLTENFKYKQSEEIINKPFIIIIDEINRGNVSAIFGELITLIEDDKRLGKDEALEVTLPYSKERFGVPSNLHIIGTMNTADRSVEALDTALRRRFSFTEIMPDATLLNGKKIGEIALNSLLITINKRIEVLLDRDHTIGHSYFIKVENENDLRTTFKNNIIPLLQEYFYGDYEKIGLVLGKGFFEVEEKINQSLFADFYTTDLSIDKTIYKLKTITDDFPILEALNELKIQE